MSAEDKLTKSELVYEAVFKEVVDNVLPPNAKLTVKELAIQYKMSEIPVREALQRLVADGIVVYSPYAGYEVPAFSGQRLKWIWEIKLGLELMASELATKNSCPKYVSMLKDNLKVSEAMIKAKNYEKFDDLNKEFHMMLYSFSENEMLCKEIEKYWSQNIKIRGHIQLIAQEKTNSVKEHEEIINAYEKGDAETVKKLIRKQRERNWFKFVDAYNTVAIASGQPTL